MIQNQNWRVLGHVTFLSAATVDGANSSFCSIQVKLKQKVSDFAWSGITGNLQWQHLWISPHAWCSGRWGNCSPTMMNGRCTECTLPWGLSWTIDKMFQNKYPEQKQSDWFRMEWNHRKLAMTASVNKSPCMIVWQMRKLFTHHDEWAVHRVYTAVRLIMDNWQDVPKQIPRTKTKWLISHGVESQETCNDSICE